MPKALDISSTSTQVALDALKALAIPSDTTVRRSAVEQEDLKLFLFIWVSLHTRLNSHYEAWSYKK